MYHYNICTEPDEDIFYKQCAALEKHIKGLKKEQILQDVDESLMQEYRLDGKIIKVYNDRYIGALYIDSEVDIEKYFD